MTDSYIIEMVSDERSVYHLIDSYEKYLIPSLKARNIDIKNYAHKLFQYGQTIEITVGNKSAGCASIYSNDVKNRVGYLSFIAVDSQYRGLGLGKALLSYSEEMARNAAMTKFLLEVHTDNKNSISFYEHMGYKSCNDESSGSFHMVKDLI